MLGERAKRHVSRGSDGHRGSMRDTTSMLHQSVAIDGKGGDFFINWVGFH
jgi:hypothetical protein